MEHNPSIHQVHSIDSNVSEILPALRNHNFDYVVDLHKNLRSKKIVSSLKLRTYTLDKKSVDRWLLVNLKIDRLKGNHIVDRYFSAVLALEVKNDGRGLELFLPPSMDNTYKLPDEYIVLVVGTKHKTKDIPVVLQNNIIQALELNVVLVGGKEHEATAEKMEHSAGCINLVGKTSLLDSAAIIKKAKLVISPDTGMMHIAAAFSRPLIAIYGSTASSLGFTPYMPQNISSFEIVEDNSLSCRPCTKMGRDTCPKKHFNCMNNLNYRTIVEKARSLID